MQSRILAESTEPAKDAKPHQFLIIDPDAVTTTNVDTWKKEGFDALVLTLDERFDAAVYRKAAKAIAAKNLDFYYWIEVGRNPAFAKDHPEWIAALGSHQDWRKRFPDVRQLQDGE